MKQNYKRWDVLIMEVHLLLNLKNLDLECNHNRDF